MSSSFPQLSIVVAVFNGEKFLPQFFNCLHAQQLENWELILVDDGSTDNSRQILDKWEKHFPNVTILTQENQGVSVARNTGFAVAKGNTLLFLILMM